MPSTRDAAFERNQSLTDMFPVNKDNVDTEFDNSSEDAESDESEKSHDYQPRLIGQNPMQYLIAFTYPDGSSTCSWAPREEFQDWLVQHWLEVQAYVKPYARQRAIEEGLWYVELYQTILVLENALWGTMRQEMTTSNGDALKRQVWSTYGDGVARMIIGHDETHYIMLARAPGYEPEASWVEKDLMREELRGEYWAWPDALKAAREYYQTDETEFGADLLLLRAEGVCIALSGKVASEGIVAVIRKRYPDLLDEGLEGRGGANLAPSGD
ncbi:hypothetical protein CLAFUW4_13236 [Fulvia fulva]|nr:hypothetical protein CLAFUR4_13241 [Fulvia fulva]WPV21107.1 hypothetical protein CLAFUW4_13236 [Fulvia fulva]WPV36190.1 hypothetical protein CLAFUW7_13243 [Fulvia fulva]